MMTRTRTAVERSNSLADLPVLADAFKNEVEAARFSGRQVLHHVLAAGDVLLKAKKITPHGQWRHWVETCCDVSQRSAEAYMRLARNRRAVEAKSQSTANLTIDGALQLLAKASKQQTEGAATAGKDNTPHKPTPKGSQTKPEQATTGPDLIADLGKASDAAIDGFIEAGKGGVPATPPINAGNDTDPEASAAQREAQDDGERRPGVPGITAHPHAERGLDLYETPPAAVRVLLGVESLEGMTWECACGPGAIVRVLREAGNHVVATDIEDHAYGCPDARGGVDFLTQTSAPHGVETILTNPPYRLANKFVRHAIALVPRVVILLPLRFLEGEGRRDILDGGKLARVYVFRNRLPMMHRAGWDGPIASSQMAFAWFVWERGHHGPATLHRISCDADATDDLAIPTFLQRTANEVVP
jgi:hypothetical protein